MRSCRLACEPCESRSPLNMLGTRVTHDERLVASDDVIDAYKQRVPDWIKSLKRPATPAVTPTFGPLAGIRAVGTGVLIAQPYIGTKLAEFGAEVIHLEHFHRRLRCLGTAISMEPREGIEPSTFSLRVAFRPHWLVLPSRASCRFALLRGHFLASAVLAGSA